MSQLETKDTKMSQLETKDTKTSQLETKDLTMSQLETKGTKMSQLETKDPTGSTWSFPRINSNTTSHPQPTHSEIERSPQLEANTTRKTDANKAVGRRTTGTIITNSLQGQLVTPSEQMITGENRIVE